MIMRYRLAQRCETGSQIVELSIVPGDHFDHAAHCVAHSAQGRSQVGDFGGKVVELAVMPVTVRATCISS